jgi:hypothetical protein
MPPWKMGVIVILEKKHGMKCNFIPAARVGKLDGVGSGGEALGGRPDIH